MASSMLAVSMSSAIEEIGLYFSSVGSDLGIWFEVAVFAGTFLVALVLKKHSEAQKLRNLSKKAGSPPDAVKETQFRRPQKAASVEGSLKVYQGALTDQNAQRVASETSKDLLRSFDEVCNAKNPAASLSLYEEMKTSGVDKTLTEIERRSRHNVQDFYNGLVQCAIRQGKPSLVEGFIINMRETGIARTRNFYESAMKMLAGKRFYSEALSVHAQQEQDGIEPSATTYSCLVNFAVELNELNLAVKFFEKLSNLQTPSIRAYMTILRAFSKQQDSTNSIKILNDMQQRKLEPDSLVVNIVLATCVNAGQLDQAEALLEEMLSKDKPLADVVSYNTVIKGYAQKGEIAKALACLEKMASNGLRPNLITFNTAMDSAVRCKQPAEAWRLLSLMRKSGLVPDKYTCSILVKGLHDGASEGNIQDCLSLLHTLGKDASKEDNGQLCEVLFLSLLDASLKMKDLKITMEIYTQLKRTGVCLSPQAFNGLVKALATGGELAACLGVWEEMLNAGVSPHSASFDALVHALRDQPELIIESIIQNSDGNSGALTTLIRALCKGRHADLAVRVYNKALNCLGTSQIDLATYVSLIGAQCECSGGVEAAARIVEDVKKAGLKPDEAVLNTLLVACFKDANVNLGKKIFEDLVGAGVCPNQATCSTMVKLYGRCQRLQDALNLVGNMQARYGLAPSTHTYACLVQACIRNKQTSQALELFQKMKEQVHVLDSTLYTTMINGCASSYNIAQGVQLVEEAFQSQLEISAETIQNLISAALRKHMPPSMSKLRELVDRYSVPLSDAARSRLFA